MIDITSPEMTLFNTAKPPSNFLLKNPNAWEIRERTPINLLKTIPSIQPQVDEETKYNTIAGNARYIVEEKPSLGVGGVARVYKAWDTRTGKYVAVKEMSSFYKNESDMENIIELEAKTIAKLNHPGIPEVYDLCVTKTPDGKKSPVIIMQLVDAEELHTKINNGDKFLTLNEISTIVTQTASTIDYMNKKGVVHTEIKPRNILLAEDYVKIIDFGGANWVDAELTTYTPSYSAPEVYHKVSKDDPRSDVYSLAATTFHMFFGDPPEHGYFDVTPILFHNDTFRYNSLSESNKLKLIEVLKKGLEISPEKRYQTSSEFAIALNEALGIKQSK